MQRRDLVRLLAATALLPWLPREAAALTALGQRVHRAGRGLDPVALTAVEAELVTALGDLIIPRTDTPGASDVGVTAFIDHLLAEWFEGPDREAFIAGLHRLEERAAPGFITLSAENQVAFLSTLDGVKGEPGSAESAFATLKALTVFGYFTSETVATQVTREPIIPGRFDGCARA